MYARTMKRSGCLRPTRFSLRMGRGGGGGGREGRVTR